MNNQSDILVSICCVTYNQASYIRQCLEGFLMQKTIFNYEILVHDDCSTDGTTEIVREYAEKYPDLIIPIYQVVNQYQQGNTSILKSFVYPKARGKYYAICEGDDYWIDSYKLQKQIQFMEDNPDCTMTCTRAKLFSVRMNKYVGEQYCRKSNGFLNPIDIINRTGLYIVTCSVVIRPWLKDNYPAYCTNCNVGDYPLQILAAMKGTVYFFNDAMCVYRIDNACSWYGQQKFNSIDSSRLKIVNGQVEMFEGFMKDYPEYRKAFNDKIAEHICKNMPSWRFPPNAFETYEKLLFDRIENFSYRWKCCYKMGKMRIPMIKFLYWVFFLRRYMPVKKFYGGYLKRCIDLWTTR